MSKRIDVGYPNQHKVNTIVAVMPTGEKAQEPKLIRLKELTFAFHQRCISMKYDNAADSEVFVKTEHNIPRLRLSTTLIFEGVLIAIVGWIKQDTSECFLEIDSDDNSVELIHYCLQVEY